MTKIIIVELTDKAHGGLWAQKPPIMGADVLRAIRAGFIQGHILSPDLGVQAEALTFLHGKPPRPGNPNNPPYGTPRALKTMMDTAQARTELSLDNGRESLEDTLTDMDTEPEWKPPEEVRNG